jgi:hypothetical protein
MNAAGPTVDAGATSVASWSVRNRSRTMPCIRALGASVLLTLLLALPLAGQSVRGRVLDAESGEAIGGARIVLQLPDGTRVAESVSGRDGLFEVTAREPGPHRIEASHLAYRAATTAEFQIDRHQQVIVDVRLSTQAIELEPLTITARRRDPRHEPTHEGFYARQRLLPPIGNNRAVTRIDPEMINARDALDVLGWMHPRPFCLIVYWNGAMQLSQDEADYRLGTSSAHLEGVEFYRYLMDAPDTFRDLPIYLAECPRYSVIALWARTGYYGEPPPPLPSRSRLNGAAGMYHVSGSAAPGPGVGAELAIHWPVTGGLALGLHARRTLHRLAPEVTEAALPEQGQWPYVMPPGRRPLALSVAGVESRLMLPRRGAVWPVVSARVQLAHRAFTLQSNSHEGFDVSIGSTGGALGVTLGGEVLVGGRFAVSAALGHDRMFFGPYGEIERYYNRTAAQWGGTSLRLGIGYALER